MEEPGFSGLLLVVAIAFAAPFLLGLAPRVRLPSVVFEIVAGIVIGPAVLGWVEVDQTIEVLSLVGLAFLLFLAGLEIDFSQLRGRLVGLAALGWAISFGIAVLVGFGLSSVGLVETLVLAAASIADFGGVILLSLFFSGESGPGSTAVLLGIFVGLLAIAFVVIRTAERSRRVRGGPPRVSGPYARSRGG